MSDANGNFEVGIQSGKPQRRFEDVTDRISKSQPPPSSNVVGLTSLITCIVGAVLPIVLGVVIAVLDNMKLVRNGADLAPLCIILFLLLEAISFVCGLLSIKTKAGMAGAIISGLLGVLAVLWMVVVFVMFLLMRK
jgi:hypothetical protein